MPTAEILEQERQERKQTIHDRRISRHRPTTAGICPNCHRPLDMDNHTVGKGQFHDKRMHRGRWVCRYVLIQKDGRLVYVHESRILKGGDLYKKVIQL